MTTPAIEVTGLTKRFEDAVALDGVSFSVPEGSLFGFLGPNGAGKTTTLRILTGLAFPTAGQAAVLGQDVTDGSTALREQVGFLPDVPGFYPWMTAVDFLRFVGRMFGLSSTVIQERTTRLLELTGLSQIGTKIGGYSRGMKQRLGIAQALMNAPKVLLLDEPTSALDPLGRKEVLDTIASLRGRATVFFSSHILADVERVCDTVAILHRGKVVRQAAVADLKRDYGTGCITVHVRSRADALATAIEKRSWVRSVDCTGLQVRITATEVAMAQREIPRVLADLDLDLVSFGIAEASLEDVFVELVGDAGP